MSCKTKPRQSSRESLRMVHAIPPDTPRPPKYQPEFSKKIEDQSGGPMTNLEAFGDEVSFQYFQKNMKIDFRHAMQDQPCQSSRESLRMVHALPPDTPRPPKYQPEL